MLSIREIRRANLRALVKEAGSQVALAERIGKDKNQIWQWLQDEGDPQARSMQHGTAREIERKMKKPPAWMDQDHTAQAVAVSENRAGYVRFPLLQVEVSAGTGAVVDQEGEVVQYLDVADWWAQQHFGRDLSRIRVITARGDSMAPDIQRGDVLFVDVSVRHFEAPGVYVLNWQGRALVKRLVPEMRSGRLGLHSTNPAYPAEYVAPDEIDQLSIAGRVAAAWTLRRY